MTHSSSTNIVEITPLFVNQLAEEARTNNPGLRAAAARVDAAHANEQSIRKWEDPMVRFGVEAAEREMRADDGDLVASMEQKLPLFGKLQAARRVAEAATKTEQSSADYQFQILRREIAAAVFKLGLANRTVEIGKQDLIWLDAMMATTERRYEAGEATQSDVLRMQNERAKRAEQLKTDSHFIQVDQVELNHFLNRALFSSWPALQLPPIARPVSYSHKLVELAVHNEPKLKMMLQQVKQAEAIVEETRLRRFPDFSVGVEVRQFSESAEIRQGMLTASFNFPWGNRKRYDADTRREQERAKASKLDAVDYELGVRTEIHHLTARIDAARREAILYRDEIIPRSEVSLEAARIAWEVNRGSFRDLLEARRLLLEAQIEYARAVSRQYQMLSELVLCCGLGDLEALEMLGDLLDSSAQTQTTERSAMSTR